MTPEEFYNKEAYSEYDKFDKSIAKFDYYFVMQFAEDYHKAATENGLLHSVSNSFHCQREEEMESKCETQCEHCKEYYKGTDNGC